MKFFFIFNSEDGIKIWEEKVKVFPNFGDRIKIWEEKWNWIGIENRFNGFHSMQCCISLGAPPSAEYSFRHLMKMWWWWRLWWWQWQLWWWRWWCDDSNDDYDEDGYNNDDNDNDDTVDDDDENVARTTCFIVHWFRYVRPLLAHTFTIFMMMMMMMMMTAIV